MNITQNLDFDMLFKSEWRKLKTFKISAEVSKKTAEKVIFFFFYRQKVPFFNHPLYLDGDFFLTFV